MFVTTRVEVGWGAADVDVDVFARSLALDASDSRDKLASRALSALADDAEAELAELEHR